MGDIGKWAGVDKDGCVLQTLDQVGFNGILKQHTHSPGNLKIFSSHRLAVVSVADHHLPQSFSQVKQAGGKGQNSHSLGGHGDIIACLARQAVGLAPQADHDLP